MSGPQSATIRFFIFSKARIVGSDAGGSAIVTGTHVFKRKARDSSVAVTVLLGASLRCSDYLNMADAIRGIDLFTTIAGMSFDAGVTTSHYRYA